MSIKTDYETTFVGAKLLRKPFIRYLAMTLFIAGFVFLLTDYYVRSVGNAYIRPAPKVETADAVLVLGAYVLPDGTLSPMLHDRVEVGYELFRRGKAPKIIVSGDHGRTDYDEVNAMKSFLKSRGVPGEDVFMDHAGFSTYESLYRARDIFGVKKLIIVTQRYHLMRAVFVARSLGLKAYGVASDRQDYGQAMLYYQLREMAARNKDFWTAKVIKPQPTFLGDAIPVFGDGRVTDDKPQP